MSEIPQDRRTRRTRIRRTVAGASLATFALAWGVIAGTGSMGASTSTTTSSSAFAAPSATYYDQQSDDDWGDTSQQQQQQQQPDLTTRQS